MSEIEDGIKSVGAYLRAVDVDRKLSSSETLRMSNMFYARTTELQVALDCLETLKMMPKNKCRSQLMTDIYLFLDPLQEEEVFDVDILDAETMKIHAENQVLKLSNNILSDKVKSLETDCFILRSKLPYLTAG